MDLEFHTYPSFPLTLANNSRKEKFEIQDVIDIDEEVLNLEEEISAKRIAMMKEMIFVFELNAFFVLEWKYYQHERRLRHIRHRIQC